MVEKKHESTRKNPNSRVAPVFFTMDIMMCRPNLSIFEEQDTLKITIDLLTSVIRIPGMPTGTGSNLDPGEMFSTARTKPAAPRALAV